MRRSSDHVVASQRGTQRARLMMVLAPILLPLGVAGLVRGSGSATFAPEPAAVAASAGAMAIAALRGQEIVLQDSCSTVGCHEDYDRGNFVHGPTAVGMCTACHEHATPERHDFVPVSGGPDLCYKCHDPMALSDHEHGPVAAGMCTSCHDPHRSEFRAMLKKDPSGPLCFSCHDQEQILADAHVHAPVVAGECLQCHSPHSAKHPMLLERTGRDLCFTCHTEMRDDLQGRDHWHTPVEQDCLLCHEPHTAPFAKQLKEDVPNLCWTCHTETHAQIDGATNVHEAITMDRQCMNCHDPHASNHPKILREATSDTCLECHDREIEMPGGRSLVNMLALLEDSAFVHGAVEQGNCAACHLPHAGSEFRLLKDHYPPKFYAPFELGEYGLCFQCHDSDLVLQEKTSAVTGFRDGERNLHFLHVNKDKKGRTCRACHEVHGSQREFHIRESVPFGSWEIPIQFEALKDGGRCSPGCHQTKEYRRG